MTIHSLAKRTQSVEFDEDQLAASAHALNVLNLGIIVVDRESRTTFANHAAKALLRNVVGLSTHSPCCADKLGRNALDWRLRRGISSSADTARGYFTLPTAGGRRLIVMVFRSAGADHSILFVSDPSAKSAMDLRPVADLYGLTPAETRLLEGLVRGDSASAYAKHWNITLHTVRWHLKELFRKTDTKRQSELLLRVLTNPIFCLVPKKSFSRCEDGTIDETQ